MKRFCEAENIKNVSYASDFRYGAFAANYNTEITDGPLKGLSARAVFVLDKNNEVKYVELVEEVGDEPNYDEALQVAGSL